MLLDINGNPTKAPKKKKTKRLSHDKFMETIKELMKNNAEEFCIFYNRDGEYFKYCNCSDTSIDTFIENHKRDKIEDTVFECLDEYFGVDEDMAIELSIEEQQEWVEEFIRELADKLAQQNDDNDKG